MTFCLGRCRWATLVQWMTEGIPVTDYRFPMDVNRLKCPWESFIAITGVLTNISNTITFEYNHFENSYSHQVNSTRAKQHVLEPCRRRLVQGLSLTPWYLIMFNLSFYGLERFLAHFHLDFILLGHLHQYFCLRIFDILTHLFEFSS